MKATLFRILGIVLAAGTVPSCRRPKEEWIAVTVIDQGSVSANVKLERTLMMSGDVEETDLTVLSGGSATAELQWPRTYSLRIRVYRSTDLTEIFDETWDGQEILDRDRTIVITVSP
jgi:hypothetical protein